MTTPRKITSADHLYGLVWDATTGELIANDAVPSTTVAPPTVVSTGPAESGIGLWLSDPANLAQWLPTGRAATDAQSQGGLGIQNVNRGFLYCEVASSNYTVTATSFTDVDATNLAGNLACSGRPLLIGAQFIGTKGTTYLATSVAVDGSVIFGRVTYTEAAGNVGQSGVAVYTTPQPGVHRFSLQAMVDGGTATIYSTPAVNAVRMVVVEL